MRFSLKEVFTRALRRALIGGLALATSWSSALAEDQETWRCDAPNGHFDQHVVPISDKSTSISGRIVIHKADFSADWSSSARISIKKHGLCNGDCNCNGILAFAFENPDVAQFNMKANGENTGVAQSEFEIPITFKIRIDSEGLMTVQIGRTSPMVKVAQLIHPEHDTLVMSCSGLDVSFLNVDVQ